MSENVTGPGPVHDLTQVTGTAPVKGIVTVNAPVILLLDTDADRERLIDALNHAYPGETLRVPVLSRKADAILAALRGSDGGGA